MKPEIQVMACPFCAKTDDWIVPQYGTADELWYTVYCDNCCTRGPSAPTEAEAIAAWNRRPGQCDIRDIYSAVRNAGRAELPADHPLARSIRPSREKIEELSGAEQSEVQALCGIRNTMFGAEHGGCEGEKPCLMCGDTRQVTDAKSWKYYPEDRPCPRCTDGTWEHAKRLLAEAAKDHP